MGVWNPRKMGVWNPGRWVSGIPEDGCLESWKMGRWVSGILVSRGRWGKIGVWNPLQSWNPGRWVSGILESSAKTKYQRRCDVRGELEHLASRADDLQSRALAQRSEPFSYKWVRERCTILRSGNAPRCGACPLLRFAGPGRPQTTSAIRPGAIRPGPMLYSSFLPPD
jgi:hypothetical protein